MDADKKHSIVGTDEICEDGGPAFTEPAQGLEEMPARPVQIEDANDEGATDIEKASSDDRSERAQEIAAKAAGAALGAAKGAASTLKDGVFALRDVRGKALMRAPRRRRSRRRSRAIRKSWNTARKSNPLTPQSSRTRAGSSLTQRLRLPRPGDALRD